ncbi:MAG: patatin-like phospholipase family protein [Steroidobacteraceae bacterium]
MVADSIRTPTEARPSTLDLALSGGGVRAMAFHAGVLSYLAENGMLERVRHVSTVSGGSLLVGLILHTSEMRWPTSSEYLNTVLPIVRMRLTTTNLQSQALRQFLHPSCWRFLFSRATVLVRAIERCWDVRATLADLPQTPIWSINATTAETGRRFRFKASGCGDYRIGYADARAFPLAQAMAVSAAFPGAIGPLSITTADYIWRKRPAWNSPLESARVVTTPFERLRLYDGGLYDNLGLEPLFDAGTHEVKTPGASIIVSDAGAPLRDGFDMSSINPRRLQRWLDVVTEQQRALRVRAFTYSLQQDLPGAYLQIGSCASDKLTSVSHPAASSGTWLSSDEVAMAAHAPTTLKGLSEQQFDRLHRHGRETAYWNSLAYPYLPAPVEP